MEHKSEQRGNPDCIEEGTVLRFLGRDFRIAIFPAAKNQAVDTEGTLQLFCKDTGKAQAVFDKWWKNLAAAVFQEAMTRLYPLVEAGGAPVPGLKTRKMTSRWGSCNTVKKSITLNLYLLMGEQDCVDYVVLHELGHLLYPYHG
ncbi:MAG: YgjP-like metallopeptidase domain-containing protein [Oscillospiraceae bacterium]